MYLARTSHRWLPLRAHSLSLLAGVPFFQSSSRGKLRFELGPLGDPGMPEIRARSTRRVLVKRANVSQTRPTTMPMDKLLKLHRDLPVHLLEGRETPLRVSRNTISRMLEVYMAYIGYKHKRSMKDHGLFTWSYHSAKPEVGMSGTGGVFGREVRLDRML